MKKIKKFLITILLIHNLFLNQIFCANQEFQLDLKSQEENIIQKENILTNGFVELPKLNSRRIELKRRNYENIVKNSKKFRRNIYLSGISIAAISLGAYIYFKRAAKENSPNNNTSANPSNFAVNLQNKGVYVTDFSGMCKYGASKGVSNGIKYGIAGAIVSIFLGIQGVFWNNLKEKFSNLWSWDHKNNFLSTTRMLDTNLKLFSTFLTEDVLCDKEEIVDSYRVFIDVVETLIALVTQTAFEYVDKGSQVYESISNSRDLLYKKVVDFTKEFQEELNKKNTFDELIAESIFPSFKQLNNYIIRFINLYYSVIYEEKDIS